MTQENLDNISDNNPNNQNLDQQKKQTDSKLMFGELLVEKGIISKDQLDIALKEQQNPESKNKLIGTILIELGFISESVFGEVLSESSGVRKIDLKSAAIDSNLLSNLPKEVAFKNKVIPVLQKDEELHIAMSDIYNIVALDQIRRYFPKNYKIIPVYAQESEILDLIDQYYGYNMTIDGILHEIEDPSYSVQKFNLNKEASESYVNPTVRLVDALLVDAIKHEASDIHFEPDESFLRLRYRIDGEMVQVRSFHKSYWQSIAVRIKIMSGMNIAESRNPQDGRITLNIVGRAVDFRVATHPTIHGENIVMRILDKKQSLVPISDLGFSKTNEALLKKLLKRPEGIIIVTGPTGSGKTTTLYSVLNYINSIEKNIMTLEDPVEYQLSLIRQSSVKDGTAMNFTDGIKSLMRQDPDIIFLGEIRDLETANMALRAAMTGHQVFTTLHTNDAVGAIPRLVNIGVERTMIAGSIICIIAQRLARKLCNFCKIQKEATPEEKKVLGLKSEENIMIYHKVGCQKCGGRGYKGRICISEILQVDKEIDELIATGATKNQILDAAYNKGFKRMADDGIQKILEGIFDLEELISNIDMTDRL